MNCGTGKPKKKNLTNDQRNGILQYLLKRVKNGNCLKRGAIKDAATEFNVCRTTIFHIWKLAKNQYSEGKKFADVSSHMKNCGRKKKDYTQAINIIKNVPLNRRGSLRSLSAAIQVPLTSLYRRFREDKQFEKISSHLKPTLTESNMKARLEFCLSHITTEGYFHDMYDYVHIDEKWFYLSQNKRSYYVNVDEETPHRSCKSKRFITKVMFMAAVARPRFDHRKGEYFDGKLGIWPFVYKEPAKRNSKNRVKGTLVTRPTESVNAEECKKMLIENVLPAIRNKFPNINKNEPIYIQQDNAKPHLKDNDEALIEEGLKDGWCIKLKSQPPNSPDLNVLDLGFFNSIQSLQHQQSPTSIDELIECVQSAFNEQHPDKLDNVFLTLQTCMESTMLEKDGNKYKIPHMSKESLRRTGRLPVSIKCSEEALATARQHVH